MGNMCRSRRRNLADGPSLVRLCVGTTAIILVPQIGRCVTLVGAYYYPWYGAFPGRHSWNDTLRAKLVPPQPPSLGYYSSRSSATIQGQIDQSHRGNIDFWAMSWWGPSPADNSTIRNNILTNPRASELQYAIHYESTGRLGSFDSPNFSNLVPEFQYLAQNYFSNPNCLRINGRPVVSPYLTRAYFNTQTGRDAVANLRQTMTSQFGIDPYRVGDDVFPGQTNATRASLWDAITDFDVYGSTLQANGSTMAAVNSLASQFASAKQVAQSVNVGFIPSVSPGFNDTAVRSGHQAASRYLTDFPGAVEGSLFSAELTQAALPNLDPAANKILMVSTFNEWHEDTQIEATIIVSPTSVDSSGLGTYTQGYAYSGYGSLYLDLLRTATVLPGDYNRDGSVDAADYVIRRKTFGYVSAIGQGADGNSNGQIDSGDYAIWFAHFGQVAAGGTVAGTLAAVPEPTPASSLIAAAVCANAVRRREP
jgi:glycoprotein endo-alpha-1,2-mannosidase